MAETGPFTVLLTRSSGRRCRVVSSLGAAHALAGRWVDRCESFGGAPYGPWAHARVKATELVPGVRLTLPDGGGAIEIRPVTWSLLCAAVGHGGTSQDPDLWKLEIMTAYNLQREQEEEEAEADG